MPRVYRARPRYTLRSLPSFGFTYLVRQRRKFPWRIKEIGTKNRQLKCRKNPNHPANYKNTLSLSMAFLIAKYFQLSAFKREEWETYPWPGEKIKRQVPSLIILMICLCSFTGTAGQPQLLPIYPIALIVD